MSAPIALPWERLGSGWLSPASDLAAQAVGVLLITGSQAAINHLGISTTARLTDFSGYWILIVAAVLTICLLIFAPGFDLARLVSVENYSGTAGGERMVSNRWAYPAVCSGLTSAGLHDHRV